MRIAVIAPPWAPVPPELYGGIEFIVDRLACGYQDAGHEVLLFATGDSTSQVPMAWALPHAEGNRIGNVVVELRHVMHAYEAVADFDIVHDHTVMGPVYAERFPDLPVVTTIHGPFNDELTDIYRRIAHRVPIIAISHAQRRHVPDDPDRPGHPPRPRRGRFPGRRRATAGTCSSSAGWPRRRAPTGPWRRPTRRASRC